MSLPELLVAKLACPNCYQPLDYHGKDDRLECLKCEIAYRVVEDIPVLQLKEAEKL